MTEQQQEGPSTDTVEGLSPLTGAEFRCHRERLGLTQQWLADDLGVALKTVRRWEYGYWPVPTERAGHLLVLVRQTDAFVDQIVEVIRADAVEQDGDPGWISTFATDEVYRRQHPELTWPASWHRAAMARVAERIPGLRIDYQRDGLGDEADGSEE